MSPQPYYYAKSSRGTSAEARAETSSLQKQQLDRVPESVLTPDSLVSADADADADAGADAAGTGAVATHAPGSSSSSSSSSGPSAAAGDSLARRRRPLPIMLQGQHSVHMSTADASVDETTPAEPPTPATPASAQGLGISGLGRGDGSSAGGRRETESTHQGARPNSPSAGTTAQVAPTASPHPASPIPLVAHAEEPQPQEDPGASLSKTTANNNAPSYTSSSAAPNNETQPTVNSTPSLAEASPPLHTRSILPDTEIVHPRPITLPASGTSTPLPSTHTFHSHHKHFADNPIRSSAFVGNVAQLEATAERLSTSTSSVEDAIRELHGELKQSDSRRSSILDSNLWTLGEDGPADAPPALCQLKRHLSTSSSIVATNSAARHGGYSPGGFIMSPTHSLTGRLRSASRASSGRPDHDAEAGLSRHGTGKASVRSVRSTKMTLAEITESEPTSLDKHAFEAADAAPPIGTVAQGGDLIAGTVEQGDAGGPGSDSFRRILDDTFKTPTLLDDHSPPSHENKVQGGDPDRPASPHSVNTFQQAQEAFVDFDGVHWQPDSELEVREPPEPTEPALPMELDPKYPTPHLAPKEMPQSRSYVDPETGQHMLYYPAPVPAMLNLPPKLSNKQKADQRHARRSQILSVIMNPDQPSDMAEQKRRSAMPEVSRKSWLPDPLAGQRNSFGALSNARWAGSTHDLPRPAEQADQGSDQEPETADEPSPLRRPQRLSQMDPGDHNPRASRMTTLPPQLRASAFFELPPAAPEIEVEPKDGSAMATLESMLDASTHAPVGAFANHATAGRLGDDAYGMETWKKNKNNARSHKSKPSTSSSHGQEPAPKETKRKSSFAWFKRGNTHASEQKVEPDTVDAIGGPEGSESRMTASEDGGSVRRHGEDEGDQSGRGESGEEEEEEEDEFGDDYEGQPTTLLAELQLRKQQQKRRTQRPPGESTYMTLLEMDAVAETQRRARQNKRVNLAWEDPGAHRDQNGSDDEDVPLAIIAAKHQGAKNMADLERPIGLMERRELEDNEPLSRRKARLTGEEPIRSTMLPKRQSIATLSAHLGGHAQIPPSQPRSQAITPEPEEPELEGETLGERRQRLAAKELPEARPVSRAFSAELLSQFGEVDDGKEKPADGANKENTGPAPVGEEEETLGQRRRRLQAEKEAREREMSYSNLVGPQGPSVSRRLSMADMLSAYPKKEADERFVHERQRAERGHWAARSRESMMASTRMQMPTSMAGPIADRSGGFRAGVYNDGRGGVVGPGPMARHARSSTALNAHGVNMAQMGYALGQQQYGGGGVGLHPMNANPYARSSMQLPMQMDASAQMAPSSVNRVEQWRHGVMP